MDNFSNIPINLNINFNLKYISKPDISHIFKFRKTTLENIQQFSHLNSNELTDEIINIPFPLLINDNLIDVKKYIRYI
jgi:hypothetical protein